MEELDIKDFLRLFFEKKLLIIVITIICILIGGSYSIFLKIPKYKSSTTIALTKVNNSDRTEYIDTRESITQTDVTLNQKLVDTYRIIVKSNAVLEKVVNNLKEMNLTVEELKKNIIVSSVEETEVIEISVININPKDAAKIANEISKVFDEQIREMYKIDNVYTLNVAKVPEKPYNINHIKTVVISAAIGIMISGFYIVIINLFDNTTKSREQVEQSVKVPVIGMLSTDEKNKKENNSSTGKRLLMTKISSKSPLAEAIKALRTNLQFMKKHKGAQTILVTSTLPDEGKSWVSANLAIAFAQAGKKTVIVDADLRKGTLNYIFDLPLTPGLSNYLSGVNIDEEEDLEELLQKTKIENLFAITAGDIPPNPSELLVSEKMQTLIKGLEKCVDIIILDSTPSMLVADAVILSRLANSTILISQYNRTKINDLKQVKDNIEQVGGSVSGIVLNQIPVKGIMYEYSYYGTYGVYGGNRKINDTKRSKKRSNGDERDRNRRK